MKKVNELVQNTPEWHEFRSEGIGASEANIIMGKSKFMTPKELWHQKVYGKREEEKTGSNFITEKGHRLEAKARPLFEMEIDSDFPDTIAISSANSVFRASLDGYSEELNKCWECKFVGQEDYETVKGGNILEKYFPQLQHQLMVTGAVSNYLFVIADDKEKKEAGDSFPYKTAWIEVLPNDEYIKDSLLPELTKFWDSVVKKKEPKMTDNDVLDLSDNSDLIGLLQEYKAQKEINEEGAKEEKRLQAEIYKIAKHTKNECNGIKITKSKSEDKDGFDYKKFEEENGIPDGYIKTTKGRVTKRITFPKS